MIDINSKISRKFIKRICPECKGTGFFITWQDDNYSVSGGTAYNELCSKCDGKGWVETDYFIELEEKEE